MKVWVNQHSDSDLYYNSKDWIMLLDMDANVENL